MTCSFTIRQGDWDELGHARFHALISYIHCRHESVATARYRLYKLWGISIVPQSVPDLPDRLIDATLKIDERSIAPDLLLDVLARDKLARVTGEQFEQSKGLWRQSHPSTAPQKLASLEVEFKNAEMNPGSHGLPSRKGIPIIDLIGSGFKARKQKPKALKWSHSGHLKVRIQPFQFGASYPMIPANKQKEKRPRPIHAFSSTLAQAMKLTAMATMAAFLACGVWATDRQKAVVCIEKDELTEIVNVASEIASKMFIPAHVALDWHRELRFCRESSGRVVIVSFSTRTSTNFMPGALAFALPYEGQHIVVFYDRIYYANPQIRTVLLAHVIVHEIAHILQGIVHHSEEGIMKARWDRNDFAVMKLQPLTFTSTDLRLIRDGMANHQVRIGNSVAAPN